MTTNTTPLQTTQEPINAVEVRRFNRNFLDRKDPSDSVGSWLGAFSLAHTYAVNRQDLPRICEELYSHVYGKSRSGEVGEVKPYVVKFIDAKFQLKEDGRQYIIIERETSRKTRMTIFVRFLAFGGNLYVGIDSFILGAINYWAIAWRVVITLLPLLFFFFQFVASSAFAFLSPRAAGNAFSTLFCCLVPFVIFLAFLWLDVIRSFSQHQDIGLALRQSFSRIPNYRSFNIDDMLMFLKSSLPLVLFSVRDVFERHNIPVKTLDEFISNINNVSINTSGGNLSMSGSSIGMGNRVESQTK